MLKWLRKKNSESTLHHCPNSDETSSFHKKKRVHSLSRSFRALASLRAFLRTFSGKWPNQDTTSVGECQHVWDCYKEVNK